MPSTFYPLLPVAGKRADLGVMRGRELVLSFTSSSHRRTGPAPYLDSMLEQPLFLCESRRAEPAPPPYAPSNNQERGPRASPGQNRKTDPGVVSAGDPNGDLRAGGLPCFLLQDALGEIAEAALGSLPRKRQ